MPKTTLNKCTIITQIRLYPGTSKDTTVNTYYANGKLEQITADDVLRKRGKVVISLGPEMLGFSSNETGTHLIRTFTAMHLVMANEHNYKIMLLGRWKSIAFMKYIRKQVQEFSKGTSTKSTSQLDFYTIPTHNTTKNSTQNQISSTSHLTIIGSTLQREEMPGLRFSVWN